MSSLQEVSVVHGVPDQMRDDAATLYDDAFGPKFAVAISDDVQRRSLLTSSLNLSFAFAAIADNRLVGLAGYKTKAGSFTDGITFESLTNHLGQLRGVWAACILGLYERSLEPTVLLMDGIVVDESNRGRGIGTLLLEALVAFACESGYASVRLDVIDTNSGAQRMYERNGFVATATEDFGFLRGLLGFGGSTTLYRHIQYSE